MAEPGEQRMAGSGAQHLLRRPQGIAPARRTHDRQMRQIDACGSQRGCIRQMRRGEPDDALSGSGQRREHGKHELQLPHPIAPAEDLGERADRPAAARQFPVELGVTRGNRFGNSGQRGAAPDGMLLQDVFDGDHGILYFYTVSGAMARGL